MDLWIFGLDVILKITLLDLIFLDLWIFGLVHKIAFFHVGLVHFGLVQPVHDDVAQSQRARFPSGQQEFDSRSVLGGDDRTGSANLPLRA